MRPWAALRSQWDGAEGRVAASPGVVTVGSYVPPFPLLPGQTLYHWQPVLCERDRDARYCCRLRLEEEGGLWLHEGSCLVSYL